MISLDDPFSKILIFDKHFKPQSVVQEKSCIRKFLLEIVIAGIIKIPYTHTIQIICSLINISGIVSGICITGKLIDYKVIYKAVYIYHRSVAMFFPVIII